MNGYEERIVQQCTKSAYLNKRSIKSTNAMNSFLQQLSYDNNMNGLVRYINFSDDIRDLDLHMSHDMGLVKVSFNNDTYTLI
jgi:hypothetical protein